MDIKSPIAEARNEYTYTASGDKLRVSSKWNTYFSTNPLIGSDVNASLLTKSKTTDYVGNKVYENGVLKRILVDDGYIENGVYYFYLTDHLGNNRAVAKSDASIVQRTQYYPFGMAFADGQGAGVQPYKFGNKELNADHGLMMYDYSARYYNGISFTSIDPLAEKYYSISPYVYCANNPMRYVDPTGSKIIFVINRKQYSYNPKSGLTDMATGKETIVKGGFAARITSAYNKIYTSGDSELTNKLQSLLDSKNSHYINIPGEGGNEVVPGSKYTTTTEDKAAIKAGKGIGTTTEFNFSERAKTSFEADTGVKASDATTVTHEMQHQYDYDQGKMKNSSYPSSARSPQEIRAVNLENRMRKIEKLPRRTKYGGEEIEPKKLK